MFAIFLVCPREGGEKGKGEEIVSIVDKIGSVDGDREDKSNEYGPLRDSSGDREPATRPLVALSKR